MTALPLVGLTAAVIYGLSLLLLALYGLHSLYLVWLFRRHLGAAAAREAGELATPLPAELPMVLVQLPVYNERDVVERLLQAVAALDWPRERLQIQLLDDSDDDAAGIAAAVVTQLRRQDRSGYKAGALEAGMAACPEAPFIAIFDADFVPPPDFLQRAMRPMLADAGLALVQGRWEHLNPDDSPLTQAQAIGIDAHFAIEQGARAWSGLAMNFNGTCGLWRRQAIIAAGGWQHETLTEDLDLSYRVQLAGWRCTYRLGLAVPGELPADIHAFRAQQFRWAKGSQQCTRKLAGAVWRSGWPLHKRIAALLHMSHYAVHPCMLASLITAPLALLFCPPPPGIVLGLGAAAFVLGVCAPIITYVIAQQSLRGRSCWRTLGRIPLLAAIGTGIAISNARAVWQAWRGVVSPFVRTPKRGTGGGSYRAAASTGIPELLASAWALLGIIVSLSIGRPWATPLLLIFASGFLAVGWSCLRSGQRQWLPTAALAGCGLVWLLGIAGVAWQPQSFAQQPLAYAGFGLLSGAAYLLACRWRHRSGRSVLLLVLAVALLGRLASLGMPISDDLNRYVVEGRLLLQGANPYLLAPADAGQVLQGDAAAALLPQTNHPQWTAIYPPLTLYVQAGISAISSSLDSMRLAMLLAEAGALLLLARLLHKRGLPAAMLLLAAWNPVLPFWLSGEGHNDALMLLALSLALNAYEAGRGWSGTIAGTAAVLLKPFAALALAPHFLRQGRRLLLIPILTLLCLLPILDAGSGLLSSLYRFGTEKHFHGALEPLLRGALLSLGLDLSTVGTLTTVLLAALLLGGGCLLLWRDHQGLAQHGPGEASVLGAKLMALLLLCLPTLHPWYLAGLVLLLPLLPHPALLLWTASAPIYWLHGLAMHDGRSWSELQVVTALAHAPGVLLLLWHVCRRSKPWRLRVWQANTSAIRP
ncbi:MAG: glycosyltransferase [Planctomycetota bacterium]